jgi:hypothetical protein
MTSLSNGNSFSTGNGTSPVSDAEAATRWGVPAWKFGLRLSDDRGSL